MSVDYDYTGSIRIEHIREYCVLAQYQTMSDAARKLGMSQQALSKHLDELERVLGHELISRTRGGKTFSLTPEGRIVFQRSIAIIDEWHGLISDLKNSWSPSQNLTVDCLHRMLVVGKLSEAIEIVRCEGMEIAIDWLTHSSEEPFDELRLGEIDIFFGSFSKHMDLHGLGNRPLFRDGAMLMMSASDKQSSLPSIPVGKLRTMKLMQPFGARMATSNWSFFDICEADGFTPKLRAATTDDEMSALMSFVCSQENYYIVPQSLQEYYASCVPGSAFVPLVGEHAWFDIRAFYRADEEPGTTLAIQQLLSAFQQLN